MCICYRENKTDVSEMMCQRIKMLKESTSAYTSSNVRYEKMMDRQHADSRTRNVDKLIVISINPSEDKIKNKVSVTY